eukprot:m.542037 g.542037  ORF g.542037 m.542037 type:complete len:303 (+) comp22114_c0_seq7:236-1144(+)
MLATAQTGGSSSMAASEDFGSPHRPISNTNASTSDAPLSAEDRERMEAQQIIDSINGEISDINAQINANKTQIATLEKECGIKHQSEFAKRMEPVTQAFTSAAAKARPVIKSAAARVSQSANDLFRKNSSPSENDSQTSSAPGSPKDEVVAQDGTVPPVLQEDIEDSTEENSVDIRRKKLQIAELTDANHDLINSVKAKESEVAWLYKKHGIARPGSFQAFSQKVGAKMEVAKEHTSQGVAKAGENARKLWKSAGTKLGKASTSFSDMVARAKEKRKSTSSAGGTEAPKSVAGEDDMYARYR